MGYARRLEQLKDRVSIKKKIVDQLSKKRIYFVARIKEIDLILKKPVRD